MSKTHINTIMPKNTLGAWDFPQPREMVIERVQQEELFVPGENKKTKKATIWFRGEQKFMVLNATNKSAIVSLYGPYIEDWRGKVVILYSAKARFGRETVDAIRIKTAAEVKQMRGRVQDTAPADLDDIRNRLGMAAASGTEAFRAEWKKLTVGLSDEDKHELEQHIDTWKASAEAVDGNRSGAGQSGVV
jgi:hypothetical protein